MNCKNKFFLYKKRKIAKKGEFEPVMDILLENHGKKGLSM